jgi:hypothetical protein
VVEAKLGPLFVDDAKLGAPLAVLAVEHENLFPLVEPEHVAEIMHLVLVELDRASAL